MLITFKSNAAGDVIMFGASAEELLRIIGKDPKAPKGIVTLEQIPDAVAQLRAAIAEDKLRQANRDPDHEERDAEQGKTGMTAPVNLAQRAWPLLEMLEYSQKEGVPVVWGV